MRWNVLPGLALVSAVALCGCSNETTTSMGTGGTSKETSAEGRGAAERQKLPVKTDGIKPDLTGKIQIDGSSTVFKISQLAAELFGEKATKVEASVGYVG